MLLVLLSNESCMRSFLSTLVSSNCVKVIFLNEDVFDWMHFLFFFVMVTVKVFQTVSMKITV